MPTFLDTTRFTVNDGVTDTPVFPIVTGLKYSWQAEENTLFFRKKMNTRLTFRDDDYTFFKGLYDSGTCEIITILIETFCGGDWATEYSGRIIISDGDYHFDRCEATYQVLPNDVYECLVRGLKKQVNMLDYGSKVLLKTILGTVEETTCIYNGLEFGSPVLRMFYKDCWSGGTQEFNTGFTPDAVTKWRPIETNNDWDTPTPGDLQLVTTWARETIVYPGGPPPGSGWTNTSGDTWVRPVMYGHVVRDEFNSDPVDQYNFEATVSDVEMSNARLLSEVIEAGIAALGCDIDEVRSDFLNINPPGTAPSNLAYDWAASYAETLLLFQKSDIVRASATGDAVRLQMTFGELLTAMRDSLNVYWGIEIDGADNILRIEHWTYFEGSNGIDLTTLAGGIYAAGLNQFQAEGTIPALERFATQEAFNDDFLQKQIEYPQECSDSETVIDYQQSGLCLDVGGLLDNDDAGLTGFVLVSAFEVDTAEYLIDNTNDEANGAMAWRVLFPALWVYGRFSPDADSTAGAFTVETIRKRKQQVPVTFKYCCPDDGEFNPTELIQTGLGWGRVKLAEQDTGAKTMKVTLLHE